LGRPANAGRPCECCYRLIAGGHRRRSSVESCSRQRSRPTRPGLASSTTSSRTRPWVHPRGDLGSRGGRTDAKRRRRTRSADHREHHLRRASAARQTQTRHRRGWPRGRHRHRSPSSRGRLSRPVRAKEVAWRALAGCATGEGSETTGTSARGVYVSVCGAPRGTRARRRRRSGSARWGSRVRPRRAALPG
jgi:hypothetical protein